MLYNVYEVFDRFIAAKTKQEKLDILRRNDSAHLRYVLKAAFHPQLKFIVDSNVNYKPSISPPGMSDSVLLHELRRMYLFEEGNPARSPNLTKEKTLSILADILESLEAREAEVLLNAMMKKVNVPGLTYKVVAEAFPGLLP